MKTVKEFTTKNGIPIRLRYPVISDLDEVLRYINTLSQEDTFITFSGEEITREDEKKYLQGLAADIQAKDTVVLYAFHENTLIGVCDINRNKKSRMRGRHVATLGISLAKEYRGQGIGRELLQTAIEEAKNNIDGLKIIMLHVYQPNEQAYKLYESVGFKEYGRLPKGVYYKNEYCDEIDMYLEL
jgi:RimJ/RimL family protein N-acetyltransferase